MTSPIQQKGDAVALYYRVKATEGFTEAAQSLFNLVHQAQRLHPDKKRVLYLDIDGHRDGVGGFDSDMFELQKEYLLGFLMQFLTEVCLPLSTVMTFRNDKPQQKEVPDTFVIKDC
jgi:hypothetical protein